MKYPILLIVLAVTGVAGFWWFSQPRIDSTGKMYVDLYEGAADTWDPKMEVVAFERAPSTMMTVRWQAPEQTYNHFLVTISKANGTLVRKESGEHDRVSLDLDALEPETEYVFAIQACLDPRCTEWFIAQDEYAGTTQAAEVTEATE
ncbi:MAG: fibronectin type III domain-containing protein [Candidatus Uhrbacteria bacterium]|nr:fibronectin type III domain-containing protein [Candidatus Uhrbacteria bacterium]